MSGILRSTEMVELAYEMFADTYPHEAAELDWQRFFALCKKRNPEVTEESVRAALEETK